MNNQTGNDIAPPRIIPTFVRGFNAVASNIHLIILPVALDLLLWFGPHVRIKNYLLPVIVDVLEWVRQTGSPQTQELIVGVEEVWRLLLERYNLLSSLSTFPFGLPSIMTVVSPLSTPVGGPSVYEVPSLGAMIAGWLIFSLLGLLFGSIYLASIANCCKRTTETDAPHEFQFKLLFWQVAQLFFMMVLLTILIVIIFVPTLVISALLVLLSPLLSWIALLAMSFFAVWTLMPLIFTLHGIFALRFNVFNAALTSARMVRFFLPGTSMFILVALVLYQGMSILWRTPAETSWMALIGIAGHAFISTGVIASSFIYYLSGFRWFQAARKAAVAQAGQTTG
jgi:hypothetical protein